MLYAYVRESFMAKKNTGELNAHHWEALKLLATNDHTVKDVARLTKFNLDHLYDLCEGNVGKCGPVATAFSSEYHKIDKELSKKIKKLTKLNKELVLEMLNARLIKLKKSGKSDSKEMTSILNALNKATHNVEIDQLNQFNSMSPEEMVIEYKRLLSLGSREVKRKRIPESVSSGSGKVPSALRERYRLLSEPEA